ncbi:MAG: NUDIX domain-containing protein, partial [Saprospiraceae bacterium]|nr:NUDIX domain-containing protein [Saprospiraceae bacterium]
KRAAALREVIEETGVQDLTIRSKIGKTYHTYRLMDKTRVLKRSYWYSMIAPDQELHPQAEEGIEKAVWVEWDSLGKDLQPVFPNITDILQKFFRRAG